MGETASGFNTTKGNAAIIHGEWKLITGDPGWEQWSTVSDKLKTDNVQTFTHNPKSAPSVHLYNLDIDPQERLNLAEVFKDKVEFLLERLNFYSLLEKMKIYFTFKPN